MIHLHIRSLPDAWTARPRSLARRATRWGVLIVAVATVLISTPALAASPPNQASFVEILQRLAGDGTAVRIDSLDDFIAWRQRLEQGAADAAAPDFATTGRKALFRFLISTKPIPQGDRIFENDIPALDRLQTAVLPAVVATGDRAYLPALDTLFRRHVERGYWPLAEEERKTILALKGNAAEQSVFDGPLYYEWLKKHGYYNGLQNLAAEADLQERPTASGPVLYDRPAPPTQGFAPYDDARARKILEEILPSYVAKEHLNGNIASWIQFERDGTYRAAWAVHNVRFYLRGPLTKPKSITVLFDERIEDGARLQARLVSVLHLGSLKLPAAPSPGKDVEARIGSTRLRCGVREYRQGALTAVRIEF